MSGLVSGIGSAVSSLFGGGAPSQPNVQVFQPTGTAQASSDLSSLNSANTAAVSGANNPYSQLSPQLLQVFQSLFNNSGTNALTSGANNAAQQYTNVGTQATQTAPQINAAVNPLLSGAQTVYNMGLDPQSALYNQQFQQQQDQSNVANAQYGLTGQQAAGNVQQADTNFNIDWQNQQLSRALAGLTGAGTADSTAADLASASTNLGNAGAAATLTGAQTPYNTQQTIGGNQETALNQYITQLLGPVTSTQTDIGNLQSAVGQGIQASNQGATQAVNDYTAQLAGATAGGAGVGSLLNYLSTGSTNGNTGTSGGSSGSGVLSSIGSLLGSSGASPAAAESIATSQLGDAYGPVSEVGSSGGIFDSIGSALATVLCTAFYKRGMVSREMWVKTQRYGQQSDPDTFAGYLFWASPIARKVTKDVWFAKLMAPIFIPPLVCEAAIMGCKKAKPTPYGWAAFYTLFGLSWACGQALKHRGAKLCHSN